MRAGTFRGYLRSVSGVSPLTLTNCMNDYPVNITVSGNSVQDGTLTADAPVEISHCGDSTINLLDFLWAFQNYDLTSANGGFIGVQLKLKADTAYTLSTNVPETTVKNTGILTCIMMLIPGTDISLASRAKYGAWDGSPRTITTDSDGNAIVAMRIKAGEINLTEDDIVSGKYWAMLQEGSEATAYEPYGYKIPVVYSGINLTNVTSYTKHNFSLNVYVEAGKTYSIKLNDFSGGWNLRVYDTNDAASAGGSTTGMLQSIYVGNTGFKKFIPSYSGYLRINGYDANGNTFKHSTIMLVEGAYTETTMPAYEPYYEPVTHNVYGPEQLTEKDTMTLCFKDKKAELVIFGETIKDVSAMQDWDNMPKIERGTNIVTIKTETEPSGLTVGYYSKE